MSTTAVEKSAGVKCGDIVSVSMLPSQPCRVVSIHEDGRITVSPTGKLLDAYAGDWGDGPMEGWDAI